MNDADPAAAEVALEARFPPRVVRRLAIRLIERAEVLSELAPQAERGADRLNQLAARERVRSAFAPVKVRPLSLRDEHRRRLREAGLVDVLEEVVVREQPDAAAEDRALVEQVRARAARGSSLVTVSFTGPSANSSPPLTWNALTGISGIGFAA